MNTTPSACVRVVRSPFMVAAVAIVSLAGMVRIAGSGPSRASAATAQPAATPGLRMGELVGRDARVTIIATGDGTRFDVRNLDGGIVAAGLTAEEVAALLPGQDPRNATAQESGRALMLAEPDRHGIE